MSDGRMEKAATICSPEILKSIKKDKFKSITFQMLLVLGRIAFDIKHLRATVCVHRTSCQCTISINSEFNFTNKQNLGQKGSGMYCSDFFFKQKMDTKIIQ